MNAKKCSWVTMRKIKKILTDEGLAGEYGALVACVSPGAVSNWRTAIKVMDAVQISEKKFKHVQHSHAEEIGRRVKDPEEWEQWVKKCEKEKLTVVQLRQRLQGGAPPQRRIANSYATAMNQFLAAIHRAQQMPGHLSSTATMIHGRHEEILKQIKLLEQLLARANAA